MIAAPQSAPTPNVQAIFSRSWSLLKRNPVVVMPQLILVGLFVAFIAVIGVSVFVSVVQHPSPAFHHRGHRSEMLPAAVTALFGIFALATLFFGIINLMVYVAMFGLADATWQRGSATWADGWAAARTRSGAMFVAGIGYIGLSIVAVLLALPTLGLSFFALPLFLMYVLPAVVAGGRGGFAAIAESARFVRHNFGPSAIALVLLLAILYGVTFIALPFILPLQVTWISTVSSLPTTPGATPNIPVPPVWEVVLLAIGEILAVLASCVIYGFGAIVLTGLYHAVRERTEFLAAAVTSAALTVTAEPPPLS